MSVDSRGRSSNIFNMLKEDFKKHRGAVSLEERPQVLAFNGFIKVAWVEKRMGDRNAGILLLTAAFEILYAGAGKAAAAAAREMEPMVVAILATFFVFPAWRRGRNSRVTQWTPRTLMSKLSSRLSL